MMDMAKRDEDLNPDLACPVCGSKSKTILGAEEAKYGNRLQCRKCGAEYWEFYMVAMFRECMGTMMPRQMQRRP